MEVESRCLSWGQPQTISFRSPTMDERSSVASPPTPESIPSTHGLISSHSSPPDSSTTPSHPITDEERQQMARAWNETLRFPNAAQPEIS